MRAALLHIGFRIVLKINTCPLLRCGVVFVFGLAVGEAADHDLPPQTVLEQTDASLQRDSSNPRLWAARGVVLSELGRDHEAIDSFEKSLSISPKYVAALEGASEVAYRSRDKRTGQYLKHLIQIQPENSVAHAMMAAIEFENRNCAHAIEHFEKASAVVKANAAALSQWGECLLALERPGPASEKLSESLKLAGPDQRIAYHLALALHLDSRDTEALRIALHLRQDAPVMGLLGAIFAAQDRTADAIVAFRRAIELEPHKVENYIDLASLCLDHQSFDVAADVVNAGIANNPESAELYTLRGAISAQTSDIERSAADFEHANRIRPDQSYGDVGLSLLLRQEDQVDEAISVVRGRIQRSPDNPTLNFLLADLLMRKPDTPAGDTRKEARQLLQKVVALKPVMAKAHATLGKLLLEADDAQGAAKELKSALDRDPNDRIALNQYTLALRRLDRRQEANRVAQKLRAVLEADRRAEVEKNRVKLVRLSGSQQ
ncbi:MAG: tetratricopeptide repeat protein [Bryobacteraceae bacterium]